MVDNIPMIRSRFAKKLVLPVMKEVNSAIGVSSCSPDEAALLYATSLLDNAREEIDRADAKASILLAASGVVVGALLAGLIAGSWTPLKLQAAVQWAWWLGLVESAIGIWCLALAVYPRERKDDSEIPGTVAYYRDVLAYSTNIQLVAALNRSAETNIDRIADQLRNVSWIVSSKYKLIRWGMRGLFLSAVTITATMVINLLVLNHLRRPPVWPRRH
jgi:MFS family permease